MSDHPVPQSLSTSHSGIFFKPEHARLWSECEGLWQLGLVDEAWQLIDSLLAEDPERTQLRILRLRFDAYGPKAAQVAKEGLKWIEREGATVDWVETTAIALLNAGRGRQAWALLKKYPYAGISRMHGFPALIHAVAAHEITTGLRLLLSTVRNIETIPSGVLLAADLAPLWEQVASGALVEEDIHILAHPEMKCFCEKSRTVARLEGIDWRTRRKVPSTLRGWLVENPQSRLWELFPVAPAWVRCEYQVWQNDLRGKHAGWLATGISRAERWFLDHQKEWAVQKALGGNFLGARWHLSWAVGSNPALLRDFECALGGFPDLAPVLEDFRAIHRVDPVLLQTLARRFLDGPMQDKDWLDDCEARIPDSSRNGLFLCHKAIFLRQAGDDLRYAEVLLALARRWPADPLGWVNLMSLCCQRAQWEGARTCATRAPRNAWHFRLFVSLIRQMDQKDRDSSLLPTCEPFFGQKNLGGILRASHFEYPAGDE